MEGEYSGDFDYTPTVINIEENISLDLMPYAHACKPVSSSLILAKPVEKYTKVFTKWDYDGYMTAKEGDMLSCPVGDMEDVYVIKRDIFNSTYELVKS